ncbi:MAG: hypothetical protein AAF744_10515 [Pseudomonadota bacterium]
MDTETLGKIAFNPGSGRFEGIVRILGPKGAWAYACEIPAPMDADMKTVSEGLRDQARARHASKHGLRSSFDVFDTYGRPPLARSFWRRTADRVLQPFLPAA